MNLLLPFTQCQPSVGTLHGMNSDSEYNPLLIGFALAAVVCARQLIGRIQRQ